jgi:hypothetical protein
MLYVWLIVLICHRKYWSVSRLLSFFTELHRFSQAKCLNVLVYYAFHMIAVDPHLSSSEVPFASSPSYLLLLPSQVAN